MNGIKKVLVTGGAGYVGSVVVRKLLEKGYQVRILDRLIFGTDPIKDIKDNIELVNADIRYADPSVFDGIDAVIHLAGFSTEPTAQYDPRLTDMINHIATENLAKTAKAKGIKRFVYASTCSVYFTMNTPLEPPFYKETDGVNPISCYSITKRCSEQVLLGMIDDNFQPIIFRKGTLYGFSPRMRYDLVFNSFAKDAFYKKILTVDADGDIWRCMIDIQDVAEAYAKALELPLEKVGGKIFNVANENWNIKDLAQKVKAILKEKRNLDVEIEVKSHGITRNYRADTTLFKEVFGFTPKRTVEEALFEIWDHIENEPGHNPHDDIHYGDRWYKKFLETPDGAEFKKYI